MIGEHDDDGHAETSVADEFDWSEDVSTFGDRLARAREFAGMTQAQLARRLGVKTATIKNWESDRSEPRANRLQMLAGLVNVSIIWLMTGEGDGGPSMQDPGDGPEIAGLRDVLDQLRDLRIAQDRLADRAGMIEKRIRELLTAN